MSAQAFSRFAFAAFLSLTAIQAQQRGGTPQTDKVQPVNSGANPYRVIRDWAQLTLEKRQWGGSNGVAIDKDGKSVWATDRCSPGTTPGCLGTKGNPVHHFDESGKEIRSFGAGLFVWPHGIHVDRDGNVWVTDARAPGAADLQKFPGEARKGSVVIKFSPEGKILMTLGKPGVRGNPPEALTDPTDVVTDPSNGDVYIAESHTDVADPNLVGRISVFDKSGKFLRTIGKAGTGPGEFRTPHALEFDSKGNLVVADRHNHRIQVLTKAGKFVREYDEFGRTSGLAIDKNDVIYTADSESTEKVHPGWMRGIRIGSLKDGRVTVFIPPHMVPNSPDGAMGEGIAIDAAGNIYTAEAQLRGVTKYVKEPTKSAWTPPRTLDGQPDLQGIWSNASIVPLERPKELEGKQLLTPEEEAAYEARVFKRSTREGPLAPGQVGTYNDYWWDADSKRAPNFRTSIIVDPPDGKVPGLTPEGRRRAEAERVYAREHPADGPEDRPLFERCLVFPMSGPPMLPSFYDNHQYGPLTSNYQIVQTHDSVALLAEVLHEMRVIPLDGRPHLPPSMRQWTGDPRGHWEGNTLVVDSTNFTGKTRFRGADENLHLIERFTRTAPDILLYEFIVDDPTAFTKPWRGEIPMIASDGPLFEHACHEGNYGLTGILGGARADERKQAK